MSIYNKLDLTGWKPQQLTSAQVKFATWIAFFAWVFAVYDFILFGTLLPEIGRHFGWDQTEQARISTWVAVGTAVIALAIGPLVDKIGRRMGIIFTVSGSAICSALTAVGGSWGTAALILIRSLSGLGYAEEGVNATYLSEVYAASDDPRLTKRRGFIYSLVQGGWPVGALLAAGLTAVLLPVIGWQGCFVFAAIPAIVIAVLARKLKESPQFQIHQRIVELRKSGDAKQAQDVAVTYGVDYEEHSSAGLGAAFRGTSLRATLVIGAAILLNWSAIQVFSVLGTSVIVSVHHISFENSLIILVLSNLVGYCGYLSHGWMGDKIGRRNVIGLGWMLGGLAFAGMLYGPSNMPVVIGLYSLGLFFLIGPYSAALFFISESFPTSIRATGGAIIHAMGPIGAVVAGFGATSVLSAGGDWQTSALYFGAIPCFLSGVLMFAARHVKPETIK